jgi:hypothetical protein
MKSSRRARFNSRVAFVACTTRFAASCAWFAVNTMRGFTPSPRSQFFCGVLLSYFGSGLVLDHSRYFTGLDS